MITHIIVWIEIEHIIHLLLFGYPIIIILIKFEERAVELWNICLVQKQRKNGAFLNGEYRVLQHIADKLKKCFREEDLLCRMGGDEFAVLLKAGMNKKELMERLDALHNSIRFRVGDIWITCSSGTAVCPADGTDFVSLYKHADKALFKAKRQGKDQNRIYIEDMGLLSPTVLTI